MHVHAWQVMAFCQVRSILFIKLWQYIVFLSLLLSGIKNTLALVNYLQSEIHFIFSSSTLYFLVTFSSLLAFTAPFIPNILLQNRDIWLLARAYLHVLYPFHVSSFALQRKEVYLQNNSSSGFGLWKSDCCSGQWHKCFKYTKKEIN